MRFFLLYILLLSSAIQLSASTEKLKWNCEQQVFDKLMLYPSPKKWESIEKSEDTFTRFASSVDPQFYYFVEQQKEKTHLKIFFKNQKITQYEFSAQACLNIVKSDKSVSQLFHKMEDSDFAKLVELSKTQNIMVYFWSPHMNLSITGVMEAKKVADQFGLKFVAVLDNKLELHSIELAAQQVSGIDIIVLSNQNTAEINKYFSGLHYPAWFILKNGSISKILRLGYSIPSVLTAEVAERL